MGFSSDGRKLWGRLVTCSGLVTRFRQLIASPRNADSQSAAGYHPAPQAPQPSLPSLNNSTFPGGGVAVDGRENVQGGVLLNGADFVPHARVKANFLHVMYLMVCIRQAGRLRAVR